MDGWRYGAQNTFQEVRFPSMGGWAFYFERASTARVDVLLGLRFAATMAASPVEIFTLQRFVYRSCCLLFC